MSHLNAVSQRGLFKRKGSPPLAENGRRVSSQKEGEVFKLAYSLKKCTNNISEWNNAEAHKETERADKILYAGADSLLVPQMRVPLYHRTKFRIVKSFREILHSKMPQSTSQSAGDFNLVVSGTFVDCTYIAIPAFSIKTCSNETLQFHIFTSCRTNGKRVLTLYWTN